MTPPTPERSRFPERPRPHRRRARRFGRGVGGRSVSGRGVIRRGTGRQRRGDADHLRQRRRSGRDAGEPGAEFGGRFGSRSRRAYRQRKGGGQNGDAGKPKSRHRTSVNQTEVAAYRRCAARRSRPRVRAIRFTPRDTRRSSSAPQKGWSAPLAVDAPDRARARPSRAGSRQRRGRAAGRGGFRHAASTAVEAGQAETEEGHGAHRIRDEAASGKRSPPIAERAGLRDAAPDIGQRGPPASSPLAASKMKKG